MKILKTNIEPDGDEITWFSYSSQSGQEVDFVTDSAALENILVSVLYIRLDHLTSLFIENTAWVLTRFISGQDEIGWGLDQL